jgi:hypothetical protein
MTKITDSVYAVEVPEGATCIEIENYGLDDALTYIYVDKIAGKMKNVIGVDDLPPGNWRVLCTTREVKAMHAPVLFGYAMLSDHYAQETIKALITSKGLDADKNHCLIEKL